MCRPLALFFLTAFLFTSTPRSQVTPPQKRDLAWVTVTGPKGFLDAIPSTDIGVVVGKNKATDITFEQIRVPTTVALIVDASASARPGFADRTRRIGLAAAGFSHFVRSAGAGNEYLVASFRKTYTSHLEPSTDYGKLAAALADLASVPRGGSSVSAPDAIRSALSAVDARPTRKKVVIVVSEGTDTDTEKRQTNPIDDLKLEDLAKHSDAILYFVYVLTDDDFQAESRTNISDVRLNAPSDPSVSDVRVAPSLFTLRKQILAKPVAQRSFLWMRNQGMASVYPISLGLGYEELTAVTGGRVFYPYGKDEVDAVFQLIAEELDHQYLLAGSPGQGPAQKFQSLKIKLAGHSEAAVRTRSGCYIN